MRAWLNLIADIAVVVGLVVSAANNDIAWVLAFGFLMVSTTLLGKNR